MASDALHIKDSIYFEVPRLLWPSHKKHISEFDPWWVRLDPDYQREEAKELIEQLVKLGVRPTNIEGLEAKWEAWKESNHAHHGKPLDGYLEEVAEGLISKANVWARKSKVGAGLSEAELVKRYVAEQSPEFGWFMPIYVEQRDAWEGAKASADHVEQYMRTATWNAEKLENYNRALDGKVFIPQYFGVPRNAYEKESGFLVTKFLVLEVALALILLTAFIWLARKVRGGNVPGGKLGTMLEGVLSFIREKIAIPAIGEHDASRFVPLLWTMFLFILGFNLFGMIPWLGAPTGDFSVTAALAAITFVVGTFCGIKAIGGVKYFTNQAPHIELKYGAGKALSVFIWLIEMAGLLIKHIVLSVRLLINMAAGHFVILGLLGLAFGAAKYIDGPGWFGIAGISILSVTLFSVLELFVAFLQAYVFTFLTALFIGSAIKEHH
jgi:F-type H+-transporting ATPase subunit a